MIPLVSFAQAIFISMISSMITELLLNKDYFNVSVGDLPVVLSDLHFWTMPGVMVLLFIMGAGYDIFGRRVGIFLTLFLEAIFLFLTPFTSPSIYPWLLIVKIFYTACCTNLMAVLFVNDYIEISGRGKVMAIF